MAIATIKLISPNGTPITLTVQADSETEIITALMDRADAIGQHYHAHGWGFAEAPATGPSASELNQQPTFCGYPCSHTTDDRGLPTWILADGERAQRRERQGDIWYSAGSEELGYTKFLRIPKGETPPKIKGV